MFLQLSGGEKNLVRTVREGAEAPLSGGLGMSSLGWRGVLGALPKSWGTLCVDFPGSGKSDLPRGELSISSLASLMVELLDFCGISRISPVGLSMGGFVALEMAWSFPERVEKLVLINTASHLEGRGLEQLALWEDLRRIGCPPELILRQQLLSTLSADFFALPQRMEQSLVFFSQISGGFLAEGPGFLPSGSGLQRVRFSGQGPGD